MNPSSPAPDDLNGRDGSARDRDARVAAPTATISLAMASACTLSFYAMLRLPQFQGGTLDRYTAHHVTEYITVALFFWGMCDLLVKWLGLRPQQRSLRRLHLPAVSAPVHPDDAGRNLRELDALLANERPTVFSQRLRNGLDFVVKQKSADGLDEHLKYLTDLDSERSHGSYALVRFIAWVTPILGFLGTVVHFTIAIAQVTPEQLEHSLGAVTMALGVAFDTTALALSLSIVVMFFIFVVERCEKTLLFDIEGKTYRLLAHRFAKVDAQAAPFIAAVRAANDEQRRHFEGMIERQAAIWAQSLAEIQKDRATHSRQLADHWSESTATSLERLQSLHISHEARLVQTLEGLAAEREHQRVERAAQSQALLATAAQLQATQESLLAMSQQLAALAATGGRLGELEKSLARNLQTLQESSKLDEAVHSLNAAIHLLTARKATDWRAAA